jgi:hypothetical protein
MDIDVELPERKKRYKTYKKGYKRRGGNVIKLQ